MFCTQEGEIWCFYLLFQHQLQKLRVQPNTALSQVEDSGSEGTQVSFFKHFLLEPNLMSYM